MQSGRDGREAGVTLFEMVDSSSSSSTAADGERVRTGPTEEEALRREVIIMRQSELFAMAQRLMPSDLWSAATLIPLEEGSPGPFLELRGRSWELVLKRTRNRHLVAKVRRRRWTKVPRHAISDLDIGRALDFVRTICSKLHH